MSFLIRPANENDRSSLFDLARQFSLLNLPADKKKIDSIIELSESSFKGECSEDKAKYLFVVEDVDSGRVAGCSQIKTKHGTPENPTYSFKVIKKERFSKALGVGFIHQVLRLRICEDGPTEIGGLVVDKNYRNRPERIGKIISLVRFFYIGMNKNKFSQELHSEMAPPLTEEGRSEFWEALGRRFTGMPYQEADLLSTQNKEFIRSLFPEEDIYLCLLSSNARLVIGRVAQQTQAALHMLEKQGFKYKEEVDPFDGGPHLGVQANEVPLIKNMGSNVLETSMNSDFGGNAFVGVEDEQGFRAVCCPVNLTERSIVVPTLAARTLKVEDGKTVFYSMT